MDWCEIYTYNQIVTFILFIVSEILGLADPEHHGIIHFFLKKNGYME